MLILQPFMYFIVYFIAIFSTTGQLLHSFAVGNAPYAVVVDYNGDILVSLCTYKQLAVY